MEEQKQVIGEGMVSKAFMCSNHRVLLVGKRDDAFGIYQNLKANMDMLEGKIHTIQIPSQLQVFKPCEEYPYGALSYIYVSGKEIDVKSCTLEQKNEIGKKLAKFLTELHAVDCLENKESTIQHEMCKVEKNLKLLIPYFTDEENKYLQKLAKQYKEFLLHANYKMTHGDLHDENVLVNEKNVLVGVIDFGNMAYTPVEFDFAPIFSNLGPDIWNSFVHHYPQQIDMHKVKLALYFRAVTFFEYVLGWSEKAILKEIEDIKNTGIFTELYKN